MVMAHHMLVPAIYHSAIRLMLVKRPRLVLRSAPLRSATTRGFWAVEHRWRPQLSWSWDRGSA